MTVNQSDDCFQQLACLDDQLITFKIIVARQKFVFKLNLLFLKSSASAIPTKNSVTLPKNVKSNIKLIDFIKPLKSIPLKIDTNKSPNPIKTSGIIIRKSLFFLIKRKKIGANKQKTSSTVKDQLCAIPVKFKSSEKPFKKEILKK